MNLESPTFSPARNVGSTARQPTLLVIDDDPSVAEGMQRSLRNHANLLCSSNGSIGREIANNRSDIDLIVLDLTMPEYDAIEFLADLRQD
ncbi:MAG: response regulator, partial [Proteobacteria bacterium]|nr:response regulator [Pseudomonadota bacterium]